MEEFRVSKSWHCQLPVNWQFQKWFSSCAVANKMLRSYTQRVDGKFTEHSKSRRFFLFDRIGFLFDDKGPEEFTSPDEQYGIEYRIMIQTTIDPRHYWSKPQLIQAIVVRIVRNFYTREERSDRARWRIDPLAVGSWDLSQATMKLSTIN